MRQKYIQKYFTIEECKNDKLQEFLDKWSEQDFEIFAIEKNEANEYEDAGINIFMVKNVMEQSGIENNQGQIRGDGMRIG